MIETPPQPQPAAPSAQPKRARVALAHDWLCGYRGGEAVLERIAALVEREFEPAGLYTMFDDGRPLSSTVDAWRGRALITATRVGTRRGALRARRWLLPRYPAMVGELSRRLDADHARKKIDLVISTSSAAIKGLRPPPFVPHLCYCHSPARYVWSQQGEYGGRGLGAALRRVGLRMYGGRFRAWDRSTAAHVTRFLANSSHTAREVAHRWGREAAVVHPPVRTGFFTPDASTQRGAFWLVVSALEPYKRVDLAIDAAALAGVELVIAGGGSERRSLERHAAGRARFVGRVSDQDLRGLYRRARLLVFPQVEDFGIIAAEALACGLPVVARRAGGALDIVTEGLTGAFFDDPAPRAVADAAAKAPSHCDAACRGAAERFAEPAFDGALLREIRALLEHGRAIRR